jgi:hypothetical protein
MTRRAMLAVVVVALGLAGCGSSSLSSSQLRTRATRVCNLARRRMNHIATPKFPTEGAKFLKGGIAVLSPELAALAALDPPGDLLGGYRRAADAQRSELALLRSALNGLRSGADPIVTIRTLEHQLVPLEARADAAWSSLAIPACLNR